jgi:hypothetical protein
MERPFFLSQLLSSNIRLKGQNGVYPLPESPVEPFQRVSQLLLFLLLRFHCTGGLGPWGECGKRGNGIPGQGLGGPPLGATGCVGRGPANALRLGPLSRGI